MKPRRMRKPKRYHADPLVQGVGFRRICVSIPPRELLMLDVMAERELRSRSELIRKAVTFYSARTSFPYDDDNGNPR